MTIQQCRYVIEIARIGSFNEASTWLFMSQASLSDAVKNLEEELGIKIFRRSNKGVSLTAEGSEFIRYATQLVSQADFIKDRYSLSNASKSLYISTQHYDFVAEVFARFINSISDSGFSVSLKERKTHEVIEDVKSSLCDLGVIAVKNTDEGVMERYLSKNRLRFDMLAKARAHIYIRRGHPLAGRKCINREELSDYGYIFYEQGENSAVQFSEELGEHSGYFKKIEITDRATLMNLLISTDCYTVGTGIMTSELNNGSVIAVPLSGEEGYSIGCIFREDARLREEAEVFVNMLGDAFRDR